MRALGRLLAEHWIAVISPVAVLAAWEWASATGVLREAFFPRPSTIVVHLRRLAADGTLWGHAAPTLARIGWAFALAAVLGVAVGLALVVGCCCDTAPRTTSWASIGGGCAWQVIRNMPSLSAVNFTTVRLPRVTVNWGT